MPYKWANNAASTLAAGIAGGDGSLTVQTGEGAEFPTLSAGDYFYATLDDGTNSEIVKVTARSTDTFTVTRAQEGTSASAFGIGTAIELRVTAAGLQRLTDATDLVALDFVIDGGGSVIATGVKGYFPVYLDGTIVAAELVADQSGSIVVDVWNANAAVPTVANTITASAKPTLSSAQRSVDSTLTGWDTDVATGDVLGINVDSATTVTLVTLALKVRRD